LDTVTQIALGAAVGEATLGRQVGRRAMLWGGICGLFPDLDVLVPLGDAVKNFTYHRGPSHSLFVLAALTPLFVYVILKLHPQTARFRIRWYALAYLAFVTHVLLDCLTVYGTQILWPLSTPPVMWSTIFIIDPAYSIPLFIGVLAALILSRKAKLGHAVNTVCLILSTGYLIWSAGAKQFVDNVAYESLTRQNINYERVLTVPAPFNTLLWRVLAMDAGGYYEGFYSLLDDSRAIRFDYYPNDSKLLDGLDRHWPVERLKWFTQGFYSVERQGKDIVITDLRMGLEPNYVFSFKVAQLGNPHAISSKSERVFGERGWQQLKWVWQRIWTEAPEVARYRGDQSSMSINEHRVGVSRPSSQFGSQSSRRLAGSQL
jgi:inner membrane protein